MVFQPAMKAFYEENGYLVVESLLTDAELDGVRRACNSDDWQRSGWRDYPLEFALDELIYRVKRITERPALSMAFSTAVSLDTPALRSSRQRRTTSSE